MKATNQRPRRTVTPGTLVPPDVLKKRVISIWKQVLNLNNPEITTKITRRLTGGLKIADVTGTELKFTELMTVTGDKNADYRRLVKKVSAMRKAFDKMQSEAFVPRPQSANTPMPAQAAAK